MEAKSEDDILAMIAGEDAEPEGDAGDVPPEAEIDTDDDVDSEADENVESDEGPDGEADQDDADTPDDEGETDEEAETEGPEGFRLTTSSGREIVLDNAEYVELPPDAPIRYKRDGEWVTGTYGELSSETSGQDFLKREIGRNREREAQLAQAAEVVHRERQNFLQWAEQAQQVGFVGPPQMPDWDSNDPIGSMEAKAQYDRDIAAYQQQQNQFHHVQQQQAQYEQAMRARQEQEQVADLLQTFPELKDPEKGREFAQRLTSGAQKHYGIPQEMFAAVKDATTLRVLNDALAYRDLKDKRTTSKKPREEAQPVTKRQARPRQQGKAFQAKKLKDRAVKSQKADDWISLLMTPES